MPKRRLRDWLSVQVSTRSPKPAIPIKVAGSAPSAAPRRDISVNPRVISAVRALAPKPMPSDIPAPMAMTFFTAPPSCTPIKSGLLYTRKLLPQCSSCWRSSEKAWSVDASEIAVGRPAASSLANVGPEITASGISVPSTSRATSCNRRPVSASSPFVAHTMRASGRISGLICCSTSPNTWLGTTIKILRLAASAVARSLSRCRESGNGTSGRNATLQRSCCSVAICFGSWPHRTTS